MSLLHGLLLLAAAHVTATSNCPFLDTSGTVLSSFTETGTHKLSCASGKVALSGSSTSFEFFSCSGSGDWYGLSCDGTALEVGAQLNVSCTTDSAVLSCPFRGSGQGFVPAVRVVNGVQVRSCGDETMNVEGTSVVGFTRATCMAEGAWALFNCDGSLQVIDGPLEAHCDSAPTEPEGVCPVAAISAVSIDDCLAWGDIEAGRCSVPVVTGTEIICPEGTQQTVMYSPDHSLTDSDIRCVSGAWMWEDKTIASLYPTGVSVACLRPEEGCSIDNGQLRPISIEDCEAKTPGLIGRCFPPEITPSGLVCPIDTNLKFDNGGGGWSVAEIICLNGVWHSDPEFTIEFLWPEGLDLACLDKNY